MTSSNSLISSYFGRSVASQATKIVTISKRTNLELSISFFIPKIGFFDATVANIPRARYFIAKDIKSAN